METGIIEIKKNFLLIIEQAINNYKICFLQHGLGNDWSFVGNINEGVIYLDSFPRIFASSSKHRNPRPLIAKFDDRDGKILPESLAISTGGRIDLEEIAGYSFRQNGSDVNLGFSKDSRFYRIFKGRGHKYFLKEILVDKTHSNYIIKRED